MLDLLVRFSIGRRIALRLSSLGVARERVDVALSRELFAAMTRQR